MTPQNNWQKQAHMDAVTEFNGRRPFISCPESVNDCLLEPRAINRRWETAILEILNGMKLYAKMHKLQYEDKIGNDGYFGPLFEEMVENIKQLMNGEKGRLDGAEMYMMLREFCEENNLEWL